MDSTPLYAIGDIHGQLDMMHHALALIEADGGATAELVFLGDYTDRGPDSKGVIDLLIAGQKAGKPWHFIKGNHDKMFVEYVTAGVEHDPHVKSNISWVNRRLGGVTTLASYGVIGEPVFEQDSDGMELLVSYGMTPAADVLKQARAAVPPEHLAFLQSLPLTYETDDLFFVHAGLRAGVAIKDQDPEDMMWIREGWLETGHDFGKLVVHGHTALDAPEHYGNRVNLDGGAGYGRPLVPVVFEGRECWTLTPKGRVSLAL